MPTTITAYNTFVAKTKIESAKVNANFSNHRGSLLPINEDTQTASNLTHDLGSTEHRYSNAYADSVFLSETTSGWSLHDDTSAVGDLVFKLAGSTVARVASSGFVISSSDSALTATSADYTLSSNDIIVMIDASGGFTLTAFLPTASGVKGRQLTLKKTDSTLTEVLLSSTVLIDAASTTTLNTEGESLTVVSNGSIWRTVSRDIPSIWTAFTQEITATATAPDKGSASIDAARFRRIGDSAEVRYDLIPGSGASSGSGTYLWLLPNSLNADTTKVAPHTLTAQAFVGVGFTNDGSNYVATVDLYTTNTVALNLQNASTNARLTSSFGGFSSGRRYSFTYTLPIKGWKG